MKTTDKKQNSLMVVSSSKKKIKVPEHQIRQRAFEIFLDREVEDEGNETTDWFQAEHELNRTTEL